VDSSGTNPGNPSVMITVRKAAGRLPPGSFAFVMATGILSTALAIVGCHVLSLVLLVIAVGSLTVLAVLAVMRVALFRPEVARDAQDPKRAFGFFTIVAAINVVGVRLYSPGAQTATIGLAVVSVPLWVLFTYGIPSTLMLRPHTDPVAGNIDGSWFLWVVATQSLATVAAVTGKATGSPAVAAVAVALWGIGVMLSLMLATLVTLRLLTVPSRLDTFAPTYWIYMGATAITVLAGSRILLLASDLPIIRATAAVVSGLTFVLWAFGVWWVPLLIVFGIWRHVVNRERVRYETGLWSIVFPLGMFSVASMYFGAVAQLAFMVTIGRVGTGVAGVAWIAVTIGMIHAGARYIRTPRHGPANIAERT